jgi:hypothetical protein
LGLLQNLKDSVTVIRPTGADEYGNPARAWDGAAETTVSGFLASPTTLILAPGTDVRLGDRVSVLGRLYAVKGEPVLARSPSAAKALVVTLSDLVEADNGG